MQQFLTSRAGSPAPFRPVRSNTLTDEDLQALEKLTNNVHITEKATSAIEGVKQQKVDIEKLESQVKAV